MNDINEKYDDMTDADWFFALCYLIYRNDKANYDIWKSFEQELLYNNRFSSNNQVIEEIYNNKDIAVKNLKKGSMLYRARVYKNASVDKLYKYYLKEQGKTDAEIKNSLNEISSTEKSTILEMRYASEKLYDVKSDKSLSTALKKWNRNIKFKGYNAKDSGAPEPDKIKNGRANPDHIRYLYLSEDIETPIYEIHPKIGDTVSVACAELTKSVKVFDLTNDRHQNKTTDSPNLKTLFETIGEMFSQPINASDATKYLPTQFISEKIKNMGFDGIRFISSVHKGGVNIVLFDPSLCKIVSSDLFVVNDISMDISKHFMYDIE
ncbi:MAG: RES family NAD+ phosphorylase [Eubacterium sp.]|nr:RES family NAD+ phosphorylase [Eubacterium sp.]